MRMVRERYLFFGPPTPYLVLVAACIFGGLFMIIYGVAANPYWSFVGLMVLLAGLWGMIALQWITFDLKQRTYLRRDGASATTKLARGGIEQLECLFLLAEERPSLGNLAGRNITYRIVLQWRGMNLPSMILLQDYRVIPSGAPLQYAADPLFQVATRIGGWTKLPVVPHAHVSISDPIRGRRP
jgi:hypothetical protein